MTYDPKIFIRDYGNPTARLLAYTGRYQVSGSDVGMLRSLVLIAENPVGGPESVLLSGDAQSGTDRLSLSGDENGNLLITNSVAIQISGNDVRLLRSLRHIADTGSFTMTGQPVGLTRSLRHIADTGSFTMTGQPVGLLRHLVMTAESGSFSLSGADVDIIAGDTLLLSGDAQSGADTLLLSGDAQSGTDAVKISYSL